MDSIQRIIFLLVAGFLLPPNVPALTILPPQAHGPRNPLKTFDNSGFKGVRGGRFLVQSKKSDCILEKKNSDTSRTLHDSKLPENIVLLETSLDQSVFAGQEAAGSPPSSRVSEYGIILEISSQAKYEYHVKVTNTREDTIVLIQEDITLSNDGAKGPAAAAAALPGVLVGGRRPPLTLTLRPGESTEDRAVYAPLPPPVPRAAAAAAAFPVAPRGQQFSRASKDDEWFNFLEAKYYFLILDDDDAISDDEDTDISAAGNPGLSSLKMANSFYLA